MSVLADRSFEFIHAIEGHHRIFGCTGDKVRHHGEAYALALFEAIETVVPARRAKNQT